MLINTLAILRGTFGNFWRLSLTTSACVNLHIDLLLITSNARYRNLLNTIMLMNSLAILLCTLGNFRTLSLTTSACVNVHINLLLITSNARYCQLVSTIMWTLSQFFGVLLVTFEHYRWLLLNDNDNNNYKNTCNDNNKCYLARVISSA